MKKITILVYLVFCVLFGILFMLYSANVLFEISIIGELIYIDFWSGVLGMILSFYLGIKNLQDLIKGAYINAEDEGIF